MKSAPPAAACAPPTPPPSGVVGASPSIPPPPSGRRLGQGRRPPRLPPRAAATALVVLAAVASVGHVAMHRSLLRSDPAAASPSPSPPPRGGGDSGASGDGSGPRGARGDGGGGGDPPVVRSVYIFPDRVNQWEGELRHFIRDGVDRSDRLRLAGDPLEEEEEEEEGGGSRGLPLWVVDVVRYKCRDLEPLARRFDAATSEERIRRRRPLRPPRVFLVDFRDNWSKYEEVLRCARALAPLIGRRNVHFATRVHVVGRSVRNDTAHAGWEDRPFHPLGEPVDYGRKALANYTNGRVRVIRYGVRSDLVQWIERRLRNATGGEGAEKDGGGPLDPASLSRPGDVAFFWKIGEDVKKAQHRDVVGVALRSLARPPHNASDVLVDTVGQRWLHGRNSVQEPYAEALLRYKIVVTCQRDRYEDHYRLMEGLAGGALVLTDPMHPLPVYLKDGDGVVVYLSIAELKRKVLYYLRPENEEERLRIARRGYRIAMDHHRSWHWMERLVFGNWSTADGI